MTNLQNRDAKIGVLNRISRQVQFYETDAMKVVHHTNYLRYFEEARVAWGLQNGLIVLDQNKAKTHLAVIDLKSKYIKPLVFGDVFEVETQVRLEKLRLIFQYRIWHQDMIKAVGETVHVPLDENLKIKPWDAETQKLLRSQSWTETWL